MSLKPTYEDIELPPFKGTVYFIRAKGTDLYKIGKTTVSVEKRVSSIQTGCPHELEVVASYDTNDPSRDEAMEHDLHQAFHHKGEWFKLPPEKARETAITMRYEKHSCFRYNIDALVNAQPESVLSGVERVAARCLTHLAFYRLSEPEDSPLDEGDFEVDSEELARQIIAHMYSAGLREDYIRYWAEDNGVDPESLHLPKREGDEEADAT